jgi:Beta-lactamase class C and other penicillin binding proteins
LRRERSNVGARIAAGLCVLIQATTFAATEAPDDLTQALEAIRKKHDLPALAAAIVTPDGATQIVATGVRKAGRPTRVTTQDRWHLGSDTKVMTATLAGTFVAEGKLSWDTKLPALFPELASRITPELRDVTFADLLTHRAGLIENLPWSDIAAQGGSLQKQRARAARMLLTTRPEHSVGTHNYSNAGYVLAGEILERIGGKSWEELITERVFRPLGMKTAGFGGVGTPGRVDQPWGHEKDGRPVLHNGPLADNPAVMGPAGTVHASIEDWAKFLADQLRGASGQKALLPPAVYAAIQTPPAGETYAFGWGVQRRPWAGGKVLTHAGSNTMNLAICWLAPRRQFGVLACANQAGPAASAACDEAVQLMIRRQSSLASTGSVTSTP